MLLMENRAHDEDGTSTQATGGPVGAAIPSAAASPVGQDRQERARLVAIGREARQRAAEAAVTLAQVQGLLHYDPDTGTFTYKVAPPRKPWLAGSVVGTTHGAGYKVVKIEQRMYLLHRLAWFYVHGVWPSQNIDHRNGIRCDNRIDNLRDVDQSTNLQNQRGPMSNNKVGFLGVRRRRGRFGAQIVVDGKPVDLGTFDTPERAHDVYVAAKRLQHPGCTI